MKTITSTKKPNPNKRKKQPQKNLTSAWVEQQQLIELPTEWEIDPQTRKIGLEAIAHIRTILSASPDASKPSPN